MRALRCFWRLWLGSLSSNRSESAHPKPPRERSPAQGSPANFRNFATSLPYSFWYTLACVPSLAASSHASALLWSVQFRESRSFWRFPPRSSSHGLLGSESLERTDILNDWFFPLPPAKAISQGGVRVREVTIGAKRFAGFPVPGSLASSPPVSLQVNLTQANGHSPNAPTSGGRPER